jgi:methyl-accepting chemotaxis protein
MTSQRKLSGSILTKIAGLSSGVVLITVISITFIGINDVKNVSLETAMAMAIAKIKGDINAFAYLIQKEYGTLRLVNNSLVDESGVSLENRFEQIDKISSDLGIVATVFMKTGNDFKRITTSIIDQTGKRATGTTLGTDSTAYIPVSRGESYIGNATILGDAYIAGYEPIFSVENRDIIGILFVGIPLSEVNTIIQSRSRSSVIRIIIISAGLLLVSIVVNLLIFRTIIVKPSQKIVDMLREISEGAGDLTKTITVNFKDEIGDLARYFNQTMEKIKNMVITIKQEAAHLSTTGGELAAHMTKTTAAINQIADNIEGIKNQTISQNVNITETNTAMDQIAGNLNNLNDHVESQIAQVSQSSSAIEEMLANIQSVTKTLTTLNN